MLETLRKKARKSNMWRIVLSVIGIGIMMAVTKFAVLDVITGPTKMDITAAPETYEGKYVTIDAEYFLYDYIEHTTTTTSKSGSKSTRTDGYSYLAFQSVPQEGSTDSVWYFYSIYFDKKHQDELSAKIDKTYEYLNDEAGTVNPPEPVKVTGTWNKMDSQTERYFQKVIGEIGIQETDLDKFYFYELNTKKIGGVSTTLFWVLTGASAILLLFAILSAVGLFSSAYMKSLQQYLQKNPTVSMQEIEEDFNCAHLISSDVWIGKKWTIYMQGNKAYILTNSDLIWGYYYSRTGRYSVSEMRLFTKDKTQHGISLSEKNTQEALKIYVDEQAQMVIGYSKDLEKMYNKDFNGFLELRYNPVMRAL